MKMTVITDKHGLVLGTYRKPENVPKGHPTFQIHGAADHTVHELDLPAEFEKIVSAKELHQRLGEHLKSIHHKRG
jgi:hypothetical protein